MSMSENTILSLLKKAWNKFTVEYHCRIPKEILKEYIKKFIYEKNNIQKYGYKYFNPEEKQEYQKWVSYLPKVDRGTQFSDITFLSSNQICRENQYPSLAQEVLDTSKVKSEFVCIMNAPCKIYDKSLLAVQYFRDMDIVYFDYDFINEDEERCYPQLLPDYSYDTLRGYNYIGNCWFVRTSIIKQFDGQPWNPYMWLLQLSDQRLRWRHVSSILYGDNTTERNEEKTLSQYLSVAYPNSIIEKNKDGITNTVKYEVQGNPLVSIIIPMRDKVEDTKKCIDSIFEKTSYHHFEIIIVDNNSVERETKEYLSKIVKLHDNICVINLDIPFNYSTINNVAIRQKSMGEFIVLLNNDTSIITSDWLEKMMSYAHLKHVGSVGVKLLYPDFSIQHAGVISGKGGVAAHRYYRVAYNQQDYMHALSIPYDVACCTAACLMFRRECFDELNGLEEKLSVNFNDVDFGLRLLEHGYQNVFLPNVELFHYESKSRGMDTSKEKVKRYLREVQFMKDRWADFIQHDPFYNNQFDKAYDYRLKAGIKSSDLL